MKISDYSPFICALLVAVAATIAPQIVRAQEQPRPAQSALNLDAKIALPTQFDAPQFFNAVAQATNARIVAPTPDAKQLAQLNQTLGARTLTFKEVAPLYKNVLGYDFADSPGNLIKVRLPDEMIYPTRALDENDAAFLRLADALSPAQIERMNLQNGLTAGDLTPAQSALYLEARRKNANFSFFLNEQKPLADEQILAQTGAISFRVSSGRAFHRR